MGIIHQLYGSSIDNLLNTNPIDNKLKEIGYLLNQSGVLNFTSFFDPKSMTHKYRVKCDGNHYYGVISDEAIRFADTTDIVNGITKLIIIERINPDPEYQFENENEQAMLDAAMDYGFV